MRKFSFPGIDLENVRLREPRKKQTQVMCRGPTPTGRGSRGRGRGRPGRPGANVGNLAKASASLRAGGDGSCEQAVADDRHVVGAMGAAG